MIQYPDLIRPCLEVAGGIAGAVVDMRETMEFCNKSNLRPIQTIILADQLDDVFEVLNNPATVIARYTLDCKKSFRKLMEDESGAVNLEATEVSENVDIPDFEDVTSPGDDEQLGGAGTQGGGTGTGQTQGQ